MRIMYKCVRFILVKVVSLSDINGSLNVINSLLHIHLFLLFMFAIVYN